MNHKFQEVNFTKFYHFSVTRINTTLPRIIFSIIAKSYLKVNLLENNIILYLKNEENCHKSQIIHWITILCSKTKEKRNMPIFIYRLFNLKSSMSKS